MKYSTLVLSALAAVTALAGSTARADNMASIAITPATGVVTLTPRWGIGSGLAGFHHMAQNIGLTGSVANNFYSIRGGNIPAGGDILAFNMYTAASGAALPHGDIGSKLTPNSYSALTSADPDVGFGSVNFYLIHHRGTTDYFSVIKPGSASASAVTDLKPMSAPGIVSTVTNVSGYFGLTFAASNLGYGLNMFYYLRTDPVTGLTKFGSMVPALDGLSADQFDLGTNGHNALAFTGTDVGYGTDKMYYLRLDPITGFTILGMLNPALGGARHTSDIANLGSVYSTLNFVPTDLGFGVNRFYTTGAVNPTWQSVSFAAIADRAISTGSFTVAPSASSGLPIALTVVPGSIGAASISGPVGGVFTVTPTGPGLITLQATQAGQTAPTAFEFNMLRQTFTITGSALLAITAQPVTHGAVAGTTTTFSVAANGTTPVTYQWRKNGTDIVGNTSATTNTLTLTNVQAADAANYYVLVSNASGSIPSDGALLTISSATPVITNSPLTAAATVNTPFNFVVTASGAPTGYTASALPAGLTFSTSTGTISGTPTVAGTTSVLLGATNTSGTGNATLVITVAAANAAPIITNSPLTAAATIGTLFNFGIVASGSPTAFTASALPAGLSFNSNTGVISGTPSTAGTTAVLLGASNTFGTGNTTLTITVAPAATAPVIANNPLTSAGNVGTPFAFTIVASGSPAVYSASALPAGLNFVPATGAITGTPTAVGTTAVVIGATNTIGTTTATLTITIAAAAPIVTPPNPGTNPPPPVVGSAPVITNNALNAAATTGAPFSYVITASGSPTTFEANGLPDGIILNSAAGVLTGTPTSPGTSVVGITVRNAFGSAFTTVTITVAPAAVAPIITSAPTAPATVGVPFVTYLIAATGLPSSYTASGLPDGLTLNVLTGAINGTPTTAGTSIVTLTARNPTGVSTATLTITVAPAAVAPIITSPTSAQGSVGTPFVTYLIGATGLPTSYTATGLPAGLTLNPLTGAITGIPTGPGGTSLVTITATNTTGTSSTVLAIVVEGLPSSRIVNFSARALSGPGAETLIMGFVVAGDGKNLLVRGIGPGLAVYGVANTLADPSLTLFGPTGTLATNDDWQTTVAGQPNAALVASTAASVGAFPLVAGSKDSALLSTFNNGAHTTSMVRPNSTSGVALTEIYDTDTTTGARLINVSARMNVTAGEGTLIAGLVIAGNAPKTVLIRGVGPTLSSFGVTGLLADPTITVFAGRTVVATNDNWGTGASTAAQLNTAFAQVGAFPLAAGSRDAVLLLTLEPGSYTVQVTGVANTTGVALVEVYDMQ